MQLVGKKENIFNDGLAYLEYHNFSRANIDDDSRVWAVTNVASICYNTNVTVGKKSLFDRLAAESKGLPSSSFEFIPMLFKYEWLRENVCVDSNYKHDITDTNMLKYGMKLIVDDIEYLLTNYRAVVYDYENLGIDYRTIYNTDEKEISIIDDNYKVFLMYVDLPTFGQAVRHRVNWQVLSRRYVSGKKVPFNFYLSREMKEISTKYTLETDGHKQSITIDTKQYIDISLALYQEALDRGVKKEDARRIIPQAAYTKAWCGFNKNQLDSFIALRSEYHAQPEIRLIANAMTELLNR